MSDPHAIPDSFDRAALQLELIRDEDLRLKVYRCTADKLSVGVGRNLDDVGLRTGEEELVGSIRAIAARGITRTQAMILLSHDIDACVADLDRKLPWWRKLDGVRQRVLINMCFNMGIGRAPDAARKITGRGLLGFANTLRLISAGAYSDASQNMLASRWAEQVGPRAARLAAMMRTGRSA